MHTNYFVKGILLDSRFKDCDIYDKIEKYETLNNVDLYKDFKIDYFNSGDYSLDALVVGVRIKVDVNLDTLPAPLRADALLELVSWIAEIENIDQKFTNEDIKLYLVPNYD